MIKILSLNVRTLYRDLKRSSTHYWVNRYRKIHNYIKSESPDVICLQEVWWPAKYVLKLGELGYKKTGWGFSHPIYVKKNMKVSKCRTSIFSTTAIVDGWIQVFSVHCRWEDNLFKRAMNKIMDWRMKFAFEPAISGIAAGDFNRSDTSSICNAVCLSSLRELMGKPSADTFANYKRPEESHGEIDHFCISAGVDASDYRVGPDDMSDHRPIICEISSNYKI